MADQAWSTADLDHASALMQDVADAMTGTGASLTDPDPAVYGQLVVFAAGHAEPATTRAAADLVTAAAEAAHDVSTGLADSARLYTEIEKSNEALADRLRATVDDLFG
ncbi:hypothetical protein GCM10009785_23240 [Brooklawnia cerclae]|uniref:Uncharacterized protein n=1 Tax=Brooklawnia cerclae TaxID=349934 RepID=A0ABX0SK21_9ACTN|nr:hypothetical protein [Brooklawnia cerclae]NIH57041.1 hypothetical protein [Brooklawnia cerclae]